MGSMQPLQLAQYLTQTTGPKYYIRENYRFAIPGNGSMDERVADAALFSSPVPSIESAAVGFIGASSSDTLSLNPDFAYLGAPFIVASSPQRIALFQIKGAAQPEKLDEVTTAHQAEWLRKTMRSLTASQLDLFSRERELLLQATRGALLVHISDLMELVSTERNLGDADAFRVAIRVLRRLSVNMNHYPVMPDELSTYARELVGRLKGRLSFENMPPESVAELYQQIAVGPDARRRRGVVYTPSWLARYIISRLPTNAFRDGVATDPACGSGTFLVCFLERLIEQRSQQSEPITPAVLSKAICGYDIDPVAIEAARLSLDFLVRAIDMKVPDWNLTVRDATIEMVAGDWIIGNLPFGHRTHGGKRDLSSVILENLATQDHKGLALLLPDSFAYTNTARRARSLLRQKYNIGEIARLPEEVFTTSHAQTMLVLGVAGKSGRDVRIHELSSQDIDGLRLGTGTPSSYTSRFPAGLDDKWRFAPSQVISIFDSAERSGQPLYPHIGDADFGIQVYGTQDQAIVTSSGPHQRPILLDTEEFASWSETAIANLPGLVAGKSEVRRAGPWDRFHYPKVIVRATTSPDSPDRLAAIPDTQGIWFGDKFVGIWTRGDISVSALAAYLQTRFVTIWFGSNNRSRKLRIRSGLNTLPVPLLPSSWWQRAANLAPPNRVVRPIKIEPDPSLFPIDDQRSEWEWFNNAVESALGIGSAEREDMLAWRQTVEMRTKQLEALAGRRVHLSPPADAWMQLAGIYENDALMHQILSAGTRPREK
jgi:hypothetical protein